MLMTPQYPPACYADMYRGHVPAYPAAVPPSASAATSSHQQSYHHNNNVTVGILVLLKKYFSGLVASNDGILFIVL